MKMNYTKIGIRINVNDRNFLGFLELLFGRYGNYLMTGSYVILLAFMMA